jgi:hypothetical protein
MARAPGSRLGPVTQPRLSRRLRMTRGQVGVDRCLHDCSSCIEVPVGEVIPHSGDIDPWDRRLSGEEIGIDGSHRLPDLDKPDPDCIRIVDEIFVFLELLSGHSERVVGQAVLRPGQHPVPVGNETLGRVTAASLPAIENLP